MMKKERNGTPEDINLKRKLVTTNGTSKLKDESPKKESPKKVHNSLAQIASAYSSDEDAQKNDEEWLVKKAKERKENANRKRKYNMANGSYFGLGKVTCKKLSNQHTVTKPFLGTTMGW